MSREIKFRCWDVVLKYWLKPDDMPTLMSDEVGEIWEFGGQDDYIFCQWTGLKDKNGVEIYEGDIVKVIYEEVRDRSNTDDPDDWCEENASIHEVHWCGDYPAFDIKPFPQYWESNGLQHAIIEHSIEVIGNIYQNPELLEAKDE